MFKLIKIIVLISVFIVSVGSISAKESYQFFKDIKTYIKKPFELRDPFKPNLRSKSHKRIKSYGAKLKGNTYSNVESIEEVPVSKIKITGVLLGKSRRAIARIISGKDGVNSNSFILKEGMKLGTDGAEIKAILPGGIVLVEKIRNVYDQDEYLETIIPVSSD